MLLVVYVASQMASTLFMAATVDKTQRILFMLMPLVFVFVIAHFPAGLVLYWVTTNLWTVGQGLITRRLVPRTPAPAPERRSSRTPPKDDGSSGNGASPEPPPPKPAPLVFAAAAPGAAQEEAHEPEMSELSADLTVEATGETVGEAKWAALRELERRHPGLDKAAVQFEVVVRGRARAPRRRLRAGPRASRICRPRRPSSGCRGACDEEPARPARRGRSWLASSTTLGVEAGVVAHDEPEAIVVTCSGADVALLIGRHGQTIDAVQYLLNVIALSRLRRGEARTSSSTRPATASGGRRRSSRSRTRVAERVRRAGEPEELEPMTAVERKVVHLRLKEVSRASSTTSEGTEPNRYVVVLPE